MQSTSLSDLTGALAVGSVAFCGMFLIVDGLSGMYLLIEEYASSSTWAIVFTIPVLVICYAIGVVAIQVATFIDDLLERREGHDSITCFLYVARLKNEQITSEYLDLRRHHRFLLGCSPSFLILGAGLFFATKWMGEFDLFGWIAGAGCIVLAVGLPVLARRLSQAAYRIGEWAKTQSPVV